MRAIVVKSHGGPEVLEVGDVPTPEPLPTEVLVGVTAAGVNPVDWKTRVGKGMAPVIGDPPYVPGWDVAGVVEATGAGVTRFDVGDEVFGMPWFPREAGAYAEYVTAPSRQFAHKPRGLSFEQAAGLPLAGLTAWQILVDTAAVGEGDRVLVHAAAGGVGHLVVQIAVARGARMFATAGAPNHDFLSGLGVERSIDYTEREFTEELEELDLVVDLVGGDEHGLESLQVLRDGGRLISVPSGVGQEVIDTAEEQGKSAGGILVEPDRVGLEGLAAMVEAGALTVELEEVYELADAAKAHEHGERGHSRGKIVLRV